MNPNPPKAKSSFLVTGSSSGLGKYLHQKLGGIAWNRKTSESEKKEIENHGVGVIIHCAFNQSRDIDSKTINQYLQDNILLTSQLIQIPHKKFIFISSVDVYPKSPQKHSEDEIISVGDADNMYSFTKLVSENLVRRFCPNLLILRCTALLGKDSRENSLIKIIKDQSPTLTLSPDSAFNYILHSDILEFIQLAIKNNLRGIYNLASSQNITLSQIATLLKKKVNFGTYIYNVGNIDNTKAAAIHSAFKKTSQELITTLISAI